MFLIQSTGNSSLKLHYNSSETLGGGVGFHEKSPIAHYLLIGSLEIRGRRQGRMCSNKAKELPGEVVLKAW